MNDELQRVTSEETQRLITKIDGMLGYDWPVRKAGTEAVTFETDATVTSAVLEHAREEGFHVSHISHEKGEVTFHRGED